MKKVLFLTVILINFISNAQVGIGTTSPHASAALEIETTNKGFLAPRVALTSNSDVATIASPATGLMIYNTATAGTSPNAVVPGYYYYSGSKWERLITTTPDATIEFNTANPNTGTPTFTPNTPSSADYIYVSSVDASQWFWNGSAYVTYVAPSSTPFYIAGTTNDAGNNKTAAIERTGSIQSSGGSIKSGKTNYIFEMNANNSSGPVLDLGTSLDAQAFWRIGAYGGINNFDTKTRDLNFFSSAKSNILYLKNNTGNVGIGTITPTNTLDVIGGVNIKATAGASGTGYGLEINTSSNAPRIDWVSNSNYIGQFSSNNTDFFLRNSLDNTGNIRFFTKTAGTGTERLTILNNGNIGINTTNPVSTLSNTSLQIQGTNVTGAINNGLNWSSAGTGFAGAFYSQSNPGNGLLVKVSGTASTNNAFEVSTGTQIGIATPLFNVLGNGNVGVGTSSPASKLDVSAGVTTANSIVNATGSINDYLQFKIQNTSTGTQAQSGYSATANNGSATTGFAWLGINNSNFNFPTSYNIGGANDVSFIGSGQDLYVANANNTKSIIFSTGKATTPFFNEQMRILNNGNVGIGNSSPSAKLVVQGVVGTGVMKLIAPSVSAGDNWWIGFGHGSTSTDANDRARIGAEIIAGGAGRLFFTTGPTGTQTRAMFIDESQRVGIGTSSPAQKLEVNSGALATPPIRLTQQTATNAATVSSTVTSAHNLVVGDNGDVLTVPYRKEFSPSTCNCSSVVPFTLPANFTYFGVLDGNYAGNGQTNTTAADYYLPTVANARAAGHSYGDVVVVYRGSGWNSVVGTTNTDLPSNYSLAPGESLVFVLTPSKWKRVNTY